MCDPHQVHCPLQLRVPQQKLSEIKHLCLILSANGSDVPEIKETLNNVHKNFANVCTCPQEDVSADIF